MAKITKARVAALKKDGTDQFLWDEGDGALKGFGVRMSPAGVASYLIQYRNAHGQTRRLKLGRVGILTPDQARTIAHKRLVAVADGADPSTERRIARGEMKVGELCDWYLREAEAGRILGRRGRPIKASTLAMDRSRINCHVKPLIGNRTVPSLTKECLSKLQSDIAEGKTAKERPTQGRTGETTGGPGVAGRTVRMLNAIIEHGRSSSDAPLSGMAAHPGRGVRQIADNKVDAFLTLDDLAALGDTMRGALADGWSRTGIAAARALLLTACRKSEILTLRDRPDPALNFLDAGARGIRFSDTKGDRQLRPLGRAAIDFLADQARHARNGFVFPADKGDGHFVAINGFLDRLVARAQITGKRITPHVLRHTFGSVATGLGYSELIIKGLIGHAARGATQIYTHVPDPALLAAADAVSGAIAVALDGGAQIILLRKRKARRQGGQI